MDAELLEFLSPLDVNAIRDRFRSQQPFSYVCIDNFLRPELAAAAARAFPAYAQAREAGKEFRALNENLKVQVTDRARFPEPVRTLDALVSSPRFLSMIEQITGIPKLLADEELAGGGMHVMAPGARLDVHVDFNLLRGSLYRRLNLLLFLNPRWSPEWGGLIEFWDRDVRNRLQALTPELNRCVIFETNDISFHGVTKVVAPPGTCRQSFAAYYYTLEKPADSSGEFHSTVFRARPSEWLRGHVAMPARELGRQARLKLRALKRLLVGQRRAS